MKAIVTKYVGPTNFRGSRISVRAEGLPKIMVHWDDALDPYENHRKAAEKFATKYGWNQEKFYGGMCQGSLPDGSEVFVFKGRGKRAPLRVLRARKRLARHTRTRHRR